MKTFPLRLSSTCLLVALALSLAGCAAADAASTVDTLALINATLIDGSGAEPLPNAVVLIQGQRIAAAGAKNDVAVPRGAKIIDLQGATILPGLINAHVHYGFDEKNLRAWANGGVTTVRDEGILTQGKFQDFMAQRDTFNQNPMNARLVSAGAMISVPKGYGGLFVNSVDEAREAVTGELDKGADLIKLSMEDGYAGKSGLPKLTDEEIAAIITAAHERGALVSGHITQARYMAILVKAGVDDIAHNAYDPVAEEVWQEMVDKHISLVPTFTVFRNYGAPIATCVANLRKFVALGGQVALGNDYGGGPGDFELGIPMYEIEQMALAGMTPMQIITASTKNAAIVSGIEAEVGTLEAGKLADILVLSADPLADLKNLGAVRMVIHNGTIIRDEAGE